MNFTAIFSIALGGLASILLTFSATGADDPRPNQPGRQSVKHASR